ncbi:GNAT family N-acetyltransferase [Haloplanus sp.]|uniref:GNAT family N-acetyltransferase n=1 Tax=Haloplanus sp. TaxID=1961696 RepID=UPI002621C3D0|nr:GNAT family protein [Haloplanus sp.]
MGLFPDRMESDRLVYERLHPETTDPLELYQHVHREAPDIDTITRYVPWDPHESPKETAEFIRDCGEAFAAGEDAHYAVRPTEGDREGELAGMAALHPDWECRLAKLGTWFRKPFWGRGYSGERAARFLELAFNRLEFEVVAVTCDPENEPSQRAIESYIDRFGGRREGRIRNDIVIGEEPRDSLRYSIARDEWERNR